MTLLFNRWSTNDVEVTDRGLQRYINLSPMIIPRTAGRNGTKFLNRAKIPIVERLMNKMMVSGHRGKKHKLTSSKQTGKTNTLYKHMKEAFEIIEKKKKVNPVQVLVQAIENTSLLEEVAAYRLGGIIARKAVTVSPQRRLDISLRFLSQGIQKASFSSKQTLAQIIADELIAASEGDTKSFAATEKNRIEKEAEGSR